MLCKLWQDADVYTMFTTYRSVVMRMTGVWDSREGEDRGVGRGGKR
jgi:hypothetical protein